MEATTAVDTIGRDEETVQHIHDSNITIVKKNQMRLIDN